MLNRYFKADGNINFIYANAALKNINFALVSLDYIMNDYHYNIGIYHDEHTYYFYHIQSLLTACGNICNVFYNNCYRGSKEHTRRCTELREIFDIKRKYYTLVFKKEIRNTNEHFDERYTDWDGKIGDYNIIDEDTDVVMKTTILSNPHLRTFDKNRKIYYTYDRNKMPIAYDFNELKIELLDMQEKIIDNPVTNCAWINELTDEVVTENRLCN